MKKILAAAIILTAGLYGCLPTSSVESEDSQSASLEADDWQMLFNGKDLSGFKASETPNCFWVEDGMIKVRGGRSHLFYVGPIENANFKNFAFSAKVKVTAGSNSGIYFHTEYQENGWPAKGYECQVNLTGSDAKKSGSLYDAFDVAEKYAEVDQWYTQEIIVVGKHVITKINGKVAADYIEAEDVNFDGWPGRRLSSGTFAIQGHDPKSIVYYKDIKVRVLK